MLVGREDGPDVMALAVGRPVANFPTDDTMGLEIVGTEVTFRASLDFTVAALRNGRYLAALSRDC